MAYGDIGAVIDTLEFDTVGGAHCSGIHVAGNIYAVAFLGSDYYLRVTTVEIDASGNITNTIIDTADFSGIWGEHPDIIHISGTVYAIVYQGANFYLTVETINIAADGTIGATVDESVLNSVDSRRPKIIHLAGNIFAISYLQTLITTNKVLTLSIAADGTIGAVVDTIDISSNGAYHSDILAVNSTMFAVLHLDTVNGTTVSTIEIDASGNITNTVVDTQVIDATVLDTTQGIIEALPGVFAIAHVGADLDGYVSTVTITTAGVISAVVDTLEFYTSDTVELNIIHIGNGFCAMTYKKAPLLDGSVSTIEIDALGNIAGALQDTLNFETVAYWDGMLLPLTGDIHCVFYSGDGHDGFAKTLDISTAPVGGPHHEMLLGMGP
jgi:hypothetical protein